MVFLFLIIIICLFLSFCSVYWNLYKLKQHTRSTVFWIFSRPQILGCCLYALGHYGKCVMCVCVCRFHSITLYWMCRNYKEGDKVPLILDQGACLLTPVSAPLIQQTHKSFTLVTWSHKRHLWLRRHPRISEWDSQVPVAMFRCPEV